MRLPASNPDDKAELFEPAGDKNLPPSHVLRTARRSQTTCDERDEHDSANTSRIILRLADNALILGQRNSEWCGHGPALEEDIALTEYQSRPDRAVALAVFARRRARNRIDRAGADGRRLRLLAAPNGSSPTIRWSNCRITGHWPAPRMRKKDYAVTIVRNVLYATFDGTFMAAA